MDTTEEMLTTQPSSGEPPAKRQCTSFNLCLYCQEETTECLVDTSHINLKRVHMTIFSFVYINDLILEMSSFFLQVNDSMVCQQKFFWRTMQRGIADATNWSRIGLTLTEMRKNFKKHLQQNASRT